MNKNIIDKIIFILLFFNKILYLCNVIDKMSSKELMLTVPPLFIQSTILILFLPFT